VSSANVLTFFSKDYSFYVILVHGDLDHSDLLNFALKTVINFYTHF
jgi:hypothetical protein